MYVKQKKNLVNVKPLEFSSNLVIHFFEFLSYIRRQLSSLKFRREKKVSTKMITLFKYRYHSLFLL